MKYLLLVLLFEKKNKLWPHFMSVTTIPVVFVLCYGYNKLRFVDGFVQRFIKRRKMHTIGIKYIYKKITKKQTMNIN